jgi:pantoate--beta-alanine ligase
MITTKTIAELKNYLLKIREKRQNIGFIPTMGALHAGHISLIERAKSENNIVVCSIFVNPTQFNDPKDLVRYPRTLESDSNSLQNAGCQVLFLPEVAEMYPGGTSSPPVIELGNLDKVMEGSQRPGHFAGVTQIVSRLLMAVEPSRAYFGQKDFQQLAIVKELVRQTGFHTEIIGCPIIREENGLAMSSRNTFLSKEERSTASGIYKTLSHIRSLADSKPVSFLLEIAKKEIAAYPGMNLEYFEIVNDQTLTPVTTLTDASGIVACIAVRLGKVRLIDNIQLK